MAVRAVRALVDYARAVVYPALFVVAHEGFLDGAGKVLVHRERQTIPIAGRAQGLELFDYASAVLLFPRERAAEELLAAQLFLGRSLFCQSVDYLDLGGDGGVVGTRQPQRFVSAHTLVTYDGILHGHGQRVTDVQLSRYVGGGIMIVKGFLSLFTCAEKYPFFVHFSYSRFSNRLGSNVVSIAIIISLSARFCKNF